MSLLARLIPKGPPAWDADARETARAAGVTASVVLVTWNRLRMLEPCVRGLMANAGDVDYELIVWDNASDDGTAEFLDALAGEDPRVRVVHSVENVGLNGVAAGVSLARGDYIVELDDDVLEFPEEWLSRMIAAFDAVPRAGYLAANVVQDGITNGAKPPADAYRARTYRGGVVIEHGPTGGWCAITSRAVVERIGNFIQMPGRVFFFEDGEFATRCRRRLYRVGIVRDVLVYHACGVTANAAFDYLEQCRTKYADDAAFRPMLDDTLAAMEDHPRE
jgi:GT2 family glycosyltransferase